MAQSSAAGWKERQSEDGDSQAEAIKTKLQAEPELEQILKAALANTRVSSSLGAVIKQVSGAEAAGTRDCGTFFKSLNEEDMASFLIWISVERLGAARKMASMSKTAKQIAPWANSQAKKALREYLSGLMKHVRLRMWLPLSVTIHFETDGRHSRGPLLV